MLAILLAGCGQKGPLYLPDQPRQAVKKNVTLPGESKEEKQEKKEKESSKEEPKAP
jgi:predicted small lipoprotein YifL